MKHSKWILILFVCTIAMTWRITHALSPQELSLFNTIEISDAVVVGKVISVNDRASDNPQAPLTEVKLSVSQVLHGAMNNQRKLTLIFRGGLSPNGLRQVYGNVPQLTAGGEYIMFLRSNFYISPLVPTSGNVLRAVIDAGRKIAVSDENQVIHASARHGLLRGPRFIEYKTMRSTTPSSTVGQPSKATENETVASTTVEPGGEPEIAKASYAASSFAQTINLIRETAQFVQLRQANHSRLPLPETLSPRRLP